MLCRRMGMLRSQTSCGWAKGPCMRWVDAEGWAEGAGTFAHELTCTCLRPSPLRSSSRSFRPPFRIYPLVEDDMYAGDKVRRNLAWCCQTGGVLQDSAHACWGKGRSACSAM